MKKLDKAIIDAIITDFKAWKYFEEDLSKSVVDKESAAIYTLAWFNLSSLNTTQGVDVMKSVLNINNAVQGTANRMKKFVASCCLKYGEEAVELYKKMCYNVLKNVYSIPQVTIDSLTEVNPCMWMCVMFTII